ncbi:MAG: hypothetical protein IKB39_09475 [Bacteroidaceae bacterium]|nr:hypothetical protein [Bacteroidaceae bacterium]MBR2459525.1 hypothetical protein [Bacteroidaceae bacterium]
MNTIPTILYLNDSYCNSLEDLQHVFQHDNIERILLDILASYRDGILTSWLSEGDACCRKMAEDLKKIDSSKFSNSELFKRIAGVINNQIGTTSDYKITYNINDYADFLGCTRGGKRIPANGSIVTMDTETPLLLFKYQFKITNPETESLNLQFLIKNSEDNIFFKDSQPLKLNVSRNSVQDVSFYVEQELKRGEYDIILKCDEVIISRINLLHKIGWWDQDYDLQKELDRCRSENRKADRAKSFAKKNDYHEAADLGLSVKWATCNVGAEIPEDYGDYFAWGEIEPKDNYSWSTYKWCSGTENSITKYCINKANGIVDNKTVLEPQDDIAHVEWGGNWRMPTKEEFKELVDKCNWKWTKSGAHTGYIITGPSGKSIFLPAAGYCTGSNFHDRESDGYFWSATLGQSHSMVSLFFRNGRSFWGCLRYRIIGQTIRPVTD